MTNGIGRVGWRTYVSPLPSSLWNNLLAYYTADNTANDAKGTYNGTLTNGATYGTGKIGSGFSLDGINDYVELGDVMDLGLNSRSFSIWFKASSSSGTLFSKSVAGPGSGRFAGFLSGNKLGLFFNGGAGDHEIYTTNTVNLNTWYNAVFIIDRNDKLKIYLNGVLQDVSISQGGWYTGTNNLISYLSVNYDNPFPFRIGSYNDYYGGGAMSLFSGLLDEFGIWNRVLTDAEIIELYNAGAGKQYVAVAPTYPIITNGLKLYYDISNPLSYAGSGTTLNDLSGNGNTGTLLNGAAYSSTNGGICVLDGINDYINIPHSTSLTKTSTGALFIYVKLANTNTRQIIINKGNIYGDISAYGMYLWGGNYEYVEIANTTTANQISNITTAGIWKQVGMVWNGTTLKKYVNGVEVASMTQTINVNDVGGPMRIGSSTSDIYNSNMSFGEVYLYDTLTPAQITANFVATKSRYGL